MFFVKLQQRIEIVGGNENDYQGPLSIEWEDSGMERVFGGTEACEFTKKLNFQPSDVAFDDALKSELSTKV